LARTESDAARANRAGQNGDGKQMTIKWSADREPAHGEDLQQVNCGSGVSGGGGGGAGDDRRPASNRVRVRFFDKKMEENLTTICEIL
jgi:hypothetical protein